MLLRTWNCALKYPKKQKEIGKKKTKQREGKRERIKKKEKPTNLTTVAETNEKRGGKKMWNAHDKSKE